MWERVAVRVAGLLIVLVLWIVGIPSAVVWWARWKRRRRDE